MTVRKEAPSRMQHFEYRLRTLWSGKFGKNNQAGVSFTGVRSHKKGTRCFTINTNAKGVDVRATKLIINLSRNIVAEQV